MSRVLASVPWLVVLLGVGLLVSLLVVALLSLRTPVRQAAPAPAPPIYLPLAPPTTSAAPTAAPLVAVGDSASATPSRSASASARPSASVRPSTSATPAPGGSRSGTVTARYQATGSDRDSFTALLTVRNGSSAAQEWRVELLFTGNVKSIRASSSSGVSVTTQGNGWYVLRGTAPLASGGSTVVEMSFSRTGSGDRPGQCTVNGAACTLA
ncbi:cellulose binding domain-containing protein [Micromonospora sp. R77]|uniref:cellulose binding domain-containing protein n=1 Tax=Micromonospora sp. R77 TaxID=2925836 RepID=UPI001F623F19|nr:cellulose binding domain-containing protein [Micromonospora sp. R77]MCI4061588.1 cellulose binding domain-containing protein [Micromonospora sp. R77]